MSNKKLRLLPLLLIIALAACSTSPERQDFISADPFQYGGISQRSRFAISALSAAKGQDEQLQQSADKSLALDFSVVVTQCKSALEQNENSLNSANNWALGVSIVGLAAGIGGAALAAKATASKSAIAFMSATAGSTNALQNQLKQSGRDPLEYLQRSTKIRDAILNNTKIFQQADIDGRQKALRNLVAECVAYS